MGFLRASAPAIFLRWINSNMTPSQKQAGMRLISVAEVKDFA
jgi:hypothetical protein